jgi:hypothetical protein
MWFNTDKVDYEKKLRKQQEDFEDSLNRQARIVKRDYATRLADRDDRIAKLESQIAFLRELNLTHQGLEAQRLQLATLEAAADHKQELLDQAEAHQESLHEAHKADMKHHHDEVLQLLEDAKNSKKEAQAELHNAKSASREAGYSDGYGKGMATAFDKTTTATAENRKMLERIANTAIVSSACVPAPVQGEKGFDAYQKLAQGFADNFATLAGKVMADNKTIIVE